MSKTTALRERFARVAESVATPLVPRDYLDLLVPLGNPEQLRGRIEAIHPETKDAVTLEIRPGRGWQPHVPGQYIRIGVDVDGVRLWRAYSLTSGPRTDGRVCVTVKAIEDGVVSNHLVRNARPGTVIQLDQATGDFTLPERQPRKVLFVTAGSGITPVMGMLRNHELDDVVLVHAAPSKHDVIFGGELRLLAKAGRLTLVENHDDKHGFLTAQRLVELVPDLVDRETWACGPIGLLDVIEHLYADKGIEDQLHTERFRPVVIVAGDGGTVTFDKTGTSTEVDGGTTLLAAGEDAGVLMPSGCRMGVCFGCVLPLKEGAVRDLRNGAITTAVEGDNVKIQTCISTAAGPCHLDI
ncbi:MAG TPA: ferredoxin reductase [Nocardioidaceae bacterium]|nr:ferredoxin reductase [Nocardioidaceae bacterium]